MKKTLIAMAVLAASGAAMAESSVTLYGVLDASYNHATQDGVSKNFMGSSQLGSSKLGFTGVEDLGGGLKANFKIEGGLNNDSGNGKGSNLINQGASTGTNGLTFQRFSYVGLSGGFGEIRMGRDYVSTFLQVQGAVDPFGTNGPADSTNLALKLAASPTNLAGATATNASNMFEYTTANLAGFKANFQYWLGENNSNAAAGKAGNGSSLVLSYANGPIFASVGQATTKAGAATATNGDYKLTSLSASYDFGAAKAVYTYAKENVDTIATGANTIGAQKNTSNLFGVIVPMGAANLKADYMVATRSNAALSSALGDAKGKMLGLGVDYSLSKRTVAYVSYAHVSNSAAGAAYPKATDAYNTGGIGSTTANNSSSNYAIGLKHAF